jgi:threonine dehydrogenase-like Zn-dependent dehydrogenase
LPKKLITPTFKLDDLMKTYDTFGNASREWDLKVLLKAA